jgi:hypothetical protein
VKNQRLLFEAFFILLGVGSLLLFQYLEAHKAMSIIEKTGVTRLVRSFEPLVQTALSAKDDLALQEYLAVLGKAPGLLHARLVSGRLEVQVSPHLRKKWLWRLLRSSFIGMTICGGMLLVYFRWIHRAQAKSQRSLLEWQSMLALETRKRELAETHAEKSVRHNNAFLQMVMDYVDRPLILLDSHQRVIALTRASLKALNIQSSEEVVNKSWHEVPLLASSGLAIQESLRNPGKTVQGFSNNRELLLEFRASHDGPQTISIQR